MKISSAKLAEYIKNTGNKIMISRKQSSLVDYIHETFNLSRDKIMDILSNRLEKLILSLDSEADYIQYALVCGFYETQKDFNPIDPSDIYEQDEIKSFEKQRKKKLKGSSDKFSMELSCVQVDDDMWVGGADVEWLMELTNAGKVRYNPEIQRTMRKVQRGGETTFEIARNRKSINGIREFYRTGKYIPNSFIFNIPIDSDYEIEYDEDRCVMTFNDRLEYLEILDGYHRYYGMCQERIVNPDFNVRVIVQITRFGVEKGSRYIHQQDLKTHFKKVDAASMDTMAPANRICAIINEMPNHPWQGQIRRNGGNINKPLLSAIIWRLYIQELKEVKQKDIRELAQEIGNKTTQIIINNPQLEERELSFSELAIVMVYCKYYLETETQTIIDLTEVSNELSKNEYRFLWRVKGAHPLSPKAIDVIREIINRYS